MPEAEHLLRPWRSTYTRDGRDGMPAHVTLLSPFLEPAEVEGELERLRVHFEAEEPFAFALREVRRFPEGVLYLAPEPDGRFRWLLDRFHALYPDRPPYDGAHSEVIPHCTIVDGADEAVLAGAQAVVASRLPVGGVALEAWLVELVAEGWSVRERLPFGR